MAPEVVSNKGYDESCDVWSLGVILYFMLSRVQPFHEGGREQTIAAIQKAYVNMTSKEGTDFVDPCWYRISDSVKNLIKMMLRLNPKTRITAAAAIKHHWFSGSPRHGKADMQQQDTVVVALRNLKNFKANSTLQKAVLCYITSQNIDHETEQAMRADFNQLDRDKDGQLSEDDLIAGYEMISSNRRAAVNRAHMAIKAADINKNGKIDYNGGSVD
jgi:calcium-dependent protein kinase